MQRSLNEQMAELVKSVLQYFGAENIDPKVLDSSVFAKVAAIQAGDLNRDKDVLLLDITSSSFGIKKADGKMIRFIPRNVSIPKKKTGRFKFGCDENGGRLEVILDKYGEPTNSKEEYEYDAFCNPILDEDGNKIKRKLEYEFVTSNFIVELFDGESDLAEENTKIASIDISSIISQSTEAQEIEITIGIDANREIDFYVKKHETNEEAKVKIG